MSDGELVFASMPAALIAFASLRGERLRREAGGAEEIAVRGAAQEHKKQSAHSTAGGGSRHGRSALHL
ncbi:hypothetical protein WMF28_14800 [Sorangium sp. So ce590]|uniref:hypothetical protein n=1 Tax=Sorangium sp. So ce590 TaxID=3133317 RepID=UPI003F5F36CC